MAHRKMRFIFRACRSQDGSKPVFNSTKCTPDLAKVVKEKSAPRCALLKASVELSGIFLIPFLQIPGCFLYKLTLFGVFLNLGKPEMFLLSKLINK